MDKSSLLDESSHNDSNANEDDQCKWPDTGILQDFVPVSSSCEIIQQVATNNCIGSLEYSQTETPECAPNRILDEGHDVPSISLATKAMRPNLTFSEKAICDICGAVVIKTSLKRHKRKHGNLFKCSICSSKFSERCALKEHERLHIEPLICDICGKKFLSRKGMRMHTRDHDESHKRNFLCDICNQQFDSKKHLQEHQNAKHYKYTPHMCDFCGKKFYYKSNLQRHLREQCNGETKIKKEVEYRCQECGTVFKHKRSMQEHLKSKHDNTAGFHCNCGKLFKWRRSYNRHRKTCNASL